MWKKNQNQTTNPPKTMRQNDKVSTDINVGEQAPSRTEVAQSHVCADLCKAVDSQFEIGRENGLSQNNFLCLLQNKENTFESPVYWSVLRWPLVPGTKQIGFFCIDSPGVWSAKLCQKLAVFVVLGKAMLTPLLSKQQRKKGVVLSQIGRSVSFKRLVCF